MAHSRGYRSRTRHLFAKGFRNKGPGALTKFQVKYKVGDIVDIKANGAYHKGMPHKYYHGKTGTVFNVTRRAVGVIVNKTVREKVLAKRIHFRVEHVVKSNVRAKLLERIQQNEKLKKEYREALAAGKDVKKPQLKRQPAGPLKAVFVRPTKAIIDLQPTPFVWKL
eukprot:UN01644